MLAARSSTSGLAEQSKTTNHCIFTSPALASPVNPNTAVSFGIGMDHDGPPIIPIFSDPPSFRCPIPQLASGFSCAAKSSRRANIFSVSSTKHKRVDRQTSNSELTLAEPGPFFWRQHHTRGLTAIGSPNGTRSVPTIKDGQECPSYIS